MRTHTLIPEIDHRRVQNISSKLNLRVKFGLYDNGGTCYFEDGTEVHYDELWAAIRTVNNLEKGHKKTLVDLYPDLFRGTFPHKFSKHNLTKRFLGILGLL